MRYRSLIPVALFLAGVVCIAASVLSGEAEVSILLIFPVFSGSSAVFMLGVAFILFSFIAGFALLMMGQVEIAGLEAYSGDGARRAASGKGDTKYGGVVLIGPVPIAFGSDRKIALAMLVAGVVIAILVLVVLAVLAG